MKRKTERGLRVYVGFSDGEQHFDAGAEASRQSGYTVCKSKRKALEIYEDVREMRLIPAKRDARRAKK